VRAPRLRAGGCGGRLSALERSMSGGFVVVEGGELWGAVPVRLSFGL